MSFRDTGLLTLREPEFVEELFEDIAAALDFDAGNTGAGSHGGSPPSVDV